MQRRTAVAALLGLTLPGAAWGQNLGRDGYRTDLPAVLTPPQPQRPPETPFQSAYRKAGNPRMVLFFNRDIADAVASGPVVQQRESATLTETARLQGKASAGPAGTQRTDAQAEKFATTPIQNDALGQPARNERDIDLRADQRIDIQRSREVSVARPSIGGRPPPVPEAQQWLFESGFNNRLGAEGARLVDRATAIRLASGLRLDDPQRLETAALRGFAEVALLVRAAPAEAGVRAEDVRGLVFRVTAIDTRTGGLLADDVVPPPEDSGRNPATVVGEAVAAVLMLRLTQRWSSRQ